MIDGLKKHVGTLTNTGSRVAVVFRKLPNDDTFCLVVETDRLPDSYHDALLQALNSKESKDTNEFYEVLNRRSFPDGLNCLTALHQKGFLKKEPVNNVTMLPLPGKSVPLELINASIDKTVDVYKQKHANDDSATLEEDTRTEEEKAKAAEDMAAAMQDPDAVAKGLIAQAEILEQDATAKREEAYALCPDLKPTRGRPAIPDELKEQKLEERKAKRRERDRKKAAERKAKAAQDAIDKRVNDKIKRDEARLNNQG